MSEGEQHIIALVNAWATYSEVTPNADLAGFCLHYLTNHQAETTTYQIAKPDADGLYNEKWAESMTGQVNRSMVAIRPDARLGALVGRLANYGSFYAKKALQPLNFKSIDDPVYLIALVQMGTPKKSELIYEMLSEFASGIDIINRLVKMELIDEFPDENDRRSKRVRITEKGLAVLHTCFPVMDQVASVAYSSLSGGEKTLLLQLLDKLDRYHADHYRQNRNSPFSDAYSRMIGESETE